MKTSDMYSNNLYFIVSIKVRQKSINSFSISFKLFNYIIKFSVSNKDFPLRVLFIMFSAIEVFMAIKNTYLSLFTITYRYLFKLVRV